MIVELLLSPVFFLVQSLLGMIDGIFSLPNWALQTIDLLTKAMMFFPLDVWGLVIANIVFWLLALFSWSAIEWIYKKIPGIN